MTTSKTQWKELNLVIHRIMSARTVSECRTSTFCDLGEARFFDGNTIGNEISLGSDHYYQRKWTGIRLFCCHWVFVGRDHAMNGANRSGLCQEREARDIGNERGLDQRTQTVSKCSLSNETGFAATNKVFLVGFAVVMPSNPCNQSIQSDLRSCSAVIAIAVDTTNECP